MNKIQELFDNRNKWELDEDQLLEKMMTEIPHEDLAKAFISNVIG